MPDLVGRGRERRSPSTDVVLGAPRVDTIRRKRPFLNLDVEHLLVVLIQEDLHLELDRRDHEVPYPMGDRVLCLSRYMFIGQA